MPKRPKKCMPPLVVGYYHIFIFFPCASFASSTFFSLSCCCFFSSSRSFRNTWFRNNSSFFSNLVSAEELQQYYTVNLGFSNLFPQEKLQEMEHRLYHYGYQLCEFCMLDPINCSKLPIHLPLRGQLRCLLEQGEEEEEKKK